MAAWAGLLHALWLPLSRCVATAPFTRVPGQHFCSVVSASGKAGCFVHHMERRHAGRYNVCGKLQCNASRGARPLAAQTHMCVCRQEKDEFVENIMRDLQALGFQHDSLTHTSDHFQPMLACARKLITAGVLYADDTAVEQMREVRHRTGRESCRPVQLACSHPRVFCWQLIRAGCSTGL